MNSITSLWLFDAFVVCMLGWFYFYFYSMFHAIADVNDKLIAMLHKTEAKDNEDGQMKLSDFIEEE
jgi:hypothetical protein